MFIPIITKPVKIPFIRNADGGVEVCFKGQTVRVCPQQFARLFPDIPTDVSKGTAKMDKACAEDLIQ